MLDLLAKFNQDRLQCDSILADVAQAAAQFATGACAIKHKRPHFWPASQRDSMLRQDRFEGCITHGAFSDTN